MKLLWLSNIDLTENLSRSGTWILSMYNSIINLDEIEELNNFTYKNCANNSVRNLIKGKQYNFTRSRRLLRQKNKNNSEIIKLILNLNPDIIHIWGSESGWDDVINDPRIEGIPKLLEIQGLRTAICLPIYREAGLDNLWHRKLSIRDYILSSLKNIQTRVVNNRLVQNEKRLIKSCSYISTQSNWVRSVLKYLKNPVTKIFKSTIILRKEFVNQQPWSEVHKFNDIKQIFILADLRIAKGLHTALEAISLVKQVFPEIKIRIAGVPDLLSSKKEYGYKGYLSQLIQRLGLYNNINFIGYIDAEQIRKEMYECDVYLNTTYIESYCLSLAESLSLGVPCIASYTSALPELIEDNINGLLFPLGDIYICASKIIEILSDTELAKSLGQQAYISMCHKHSVEKASAQQISTYFEILTKEII